MLHEHAAPGSVSHRDHLVRILMALTNQDSSQAISPLARKNASVFFELVEGWKKKLENKSVIAPGAAESAVASGSPGAAGSAVTLGSHGAAASAVPSASHGAAASAVASDAKAAEEAVGVAVDGAVGTLPTPAVWVKVRANMFHRHG